MERKKLLFIINIIFIIFPNLVAQIADPVKWQASYKSINNKEGEIIIEAIIEKGYHIYGSYFAEGGPIRTHFIFPKSPDYKLKGKIREITKPKLKRDPAFDNMEVSLHSKKAVFSQSVQLNTKSDIVLTFDVEYMACTDETCLPPVTKTITVNLTSSQQLPANKTLDIDKNTTTDDTTTVQKIDTIQPHQQVDFENKTTTNKAEDPLWYFLIISLLAGIAGVFTPCVFPMIPMIVSFFMRNSENRRRAIGMGIFFGLSITFLYTLVGVLVSLTSIGSNFAAQISYHWLPNLIFFTLFVAFSLSFLGMFEIVLPSSVINAADKNVDKGGWIGTFFMAVVTVLVSFSCTGPILGALLVEAVGKFALKPILGMMIFGIAFAFPFTLFAIFPSALKKLPKSGGWLNEVKVVLGTLMLAFGVKFLINIDQSYHLNLVSRDFVLILWTILAFFLGLYLLGKIRLNHDTEIDKISTLRLMLVLFFWLISLYFFSGVMGKNSLTPFAGFLPADKSLSIVPAINTKEPLKNNSICDQPKYSNILSFPHGLTGYFDYHQALSCAQKLNKPVLIDFKAHTCSNCKKMEATVWANPEVLHRLKNDFILVALYTDERTKLDENEIYTSTYDGKIIRTLGQKNTDIEITFFKSNALPLYVIVDPNGNILSGPIGTEYNVEKYINFLDEGLFKFKKQQ